MKRIPLLEIPDDSWELAGSDKDLKSRLMTAVRINGTLHHLEAYAVKVENHIQEVVDPEFEANYEGICMASEPNGQYQTTEIMGREYVLVMTPFC
jgi:hypothetical protein